MLLYCILVLHDNVVYTNNHPSRLQVHEIRFVWLDLGNILFIVGHGLQCLQIVYPKLCRSIEFKNGSCTLDAPKIAEFWGGMILHKRVQLV